MSLAPHDGLHGHRFQEEDAMPKVIADITMSLDGFVTGEGADEQHGLGDAPELHTWVRQQDAVDTEVLAQATAQSGAVVMGRRLFDLVNGPGGWSKDMGYGADQAGTPPFFVVTHSPRQDVRLERDLGMRFTFVSDLVTAIGQARSAATDGDVVIMGGGDIIGQALEQGLIDELRLHLAPMVLGGGTPLFKSGTRQMYRQREVRPSRNAVHLTYERV
jgi:dihydrofolate reductase